MSLKSSPSNKSITSLEQISSSEFSALVSLYEATNGPKWRNSKNWIVDKKSLFRWQGVETHESGRVSKLRLLMNELSGIIPETISALNEIVYLDMSNNKLISTIPSSISKLTKLKDLKLHYNQLSGAIPDSIGSLTSLRGLHLESNSFTGIIPQSIRYLTALTKLNLGLSQLSGPIPDCIMDLTSLQELKLNNNKLSGDIPRGWDRLTALKVLCLHDNKLTGEIPPELGSMPSLRKLHLNNNHLSGKLPLTFKAHCHKHGQAAVTSNGVVLHVLNLKVENNHLTGPLTIEELGQTGTLKKMVIGGAWIALALCVYIVIPLLLPFTVGVCLHNHVQFVYPPPPPVANIHNNNDNNNPSTRQSTYKGLTMDQVNEESAHSHSGEQSGSSSSAVTCRVPSYCRAVFLQWAFPLVVYRSITLGEVEVDALFRAVTQDDALNNRAVQFHVITVTPAIAQIVANAVSGSVGRTALSSVSISAIESVLAPPVKETLLAAVRTRNSSDCCPLKISYNRHDIASEKVTLHIAGLGYLTEYIAKHRPLGGALSGYFEKRQQQQQQKTMQSSHSEEEREHEAILLPAEPVTAGSVFRWLSDLLECSLQFDLSHHPKCRVHSWGRQQQVEHTTNNAAHSVSTVQTTRSSNAPPAASRRQQVTSFLVEQCHLSAQLAEQLQGVLGVESSADLTLLEPRDLSDVLKLPLIPQRKLVKCVCDGSLLPLTTKGGRVEDRPLCHHSASTTAVVGGSASSDATAAVDDDVGEKEVTENITKDGSEDVLVGPTSNEKEEL